MYLQSGRISHLNMTDAARATLRNLINITLGVCALEMTKLCLNTNRNEGLDRSLCNGVGLHLVVCPLQVEQSDFAAIGTGKICSDRLCHYNPLLRRANKFLNFLCPRSLYLKYFLC